MESLRSLFNVFLHLDKHLDSLVSQYGAWAYALIFIIIFCETGLIVMPFLPGDSLLFAAGAIAAASSQFNVNVVAVIIFVAAVIGDAVNYTVGGRVGASREKVAKLIKQEHLDRTAAFFEKYGGKAIVIARFVPIVRTVAPFLAGVGSMSYGKFFAWNVAGAALWVLLFVYGGFFFGNLPIVKDNFSLVILGIIVVSLIPAFIETVRARKASLRAL
jgi:membrane-associated protein